MVVMHLSALHLLSALEAELCLFLGRKAALVEAQLEVMVSGFLRFINREGQDIPSPSRMLYALGPKQT